jgi:hypothetical protein
MKLTLLLSLPCLTTAFTSVSVKRTNVSLGASRDNVAAAAAASIMAGLLTSQVASAALDMPISQPASVSSIMLSATTVDQFTLPSYESAKGVTVIDLKDEVQDVNKKTMANAKAKREVSLLFFGT